MARLWHAGGGFHHIDQLVDGGHHPDVAGQARSCASEDVDSVAYVQGEFQVTGVPDGVEEDTAVWDVDANEPPTPSSTSITALVTRLGCSGGETGKVLDPVVSADGEQVVVTFSVESLPPDGEYECPANDAVPYVVELDEPLGDREIVDGACLQGEAASTSHCAEGAIRWPPSA